MKNSTLRIRLWLPVIAMLLSAFSAHADAESYITLGTDGTVAVAPCDLGNHINVVANAHFERRLNIWSLDLTLPEGLSVSDVQAGPDMTVIYPNHLLHDSTYTAVLNVSNYGLTISMIIEYVWDYWDYNHDGVPESYGWIKWEAGDYGNLFSVDFLVSQDFKGGDIIIDGYLCSSPDYRGPTIGNINVPFQKTVKVIVGYEKGDVNGDGVINVADVTELIGLLLEGNLDTLDQYRAAAADLTGNGKINVSDITSLIDKLLAQ